MYFGSSFRLTCAALIIWISMSAHAAAAPLNEAGLDAIFSQASFGNTPIDIRIKSEIEHVAPSLVDIRVNFNPTNPFDLGELDDLFGLGSSGPVVDLFWVDSIFFIFGFASGIAEVLPDQSTGNGVAVDRGTPMNSLTEVVAHEIGHTLGLNHVGVPSPGTFGPIDYGIENLMSVGANGSTKLDAAQVATIFGSSLIQGDAAQGFFIEVQPYNVVAVATVSPVPLPAALPLIAGGLGLLGFLGWRRKRKFGAG